MIEDRLQEFCARAARATTVEELAVILIEAGWGRERGDPPIETWPAFRIVVPVLSAYLSRSSQTT